MAASAEALTVIAMDDSEVVLSAVKIVLEGEGLRVRTAQNLAQLEAALALGVPDVFVLDVEMPEMYGYHVGEVLKKVRSLAVPIFLFSSLEPHVLAAHVAESELDGYVPKDAGVSVLAERVLERLRG